MCRVSYGFESFGSAYPDAFNGAVPAEIMGAVLSSIAQKIKNCNDRSGWKENVVDNSLIYLFNLHYVSRMYPNLSRLPLSKIRLSDFTNTATIYPPNVSSDIYFLYIFIYSSFGFMTLQFKVFTVFISVANVQNLQSEGFSDPRIYNFKNEVWPKCHLTKTLQSGSRREFSKENKEDFSVGLGGRGGGGGRGGCSLATDACSCPSIKKLLEKSPTLLAISVSGFRRILTKTTALAQWLPLLILCDSLALNRLVPVT